MASSMGSLGRHNNYERTSAEENEYCQGGSAKRWYATGLFKLASHQAKKVTLRKAEQKKKLSNILAPSAQESVGPAGIPSPTSVTSLTQTNGSAPPRPARPSSTIIRDVHTWLDATVIRPSPGVMGGIPYWRDPSTFSSSPSSSDVQYAVPIVNHSRIESDGSETSSESHRRHRIRFIARSPPKVHVRMRSMPLLPSQRHERDTSSSAPKHHSKSLMTLLSRSTIQKLPTADALEVVAVQANRRNILRGTCRWGWMKNLWVSREDELVLVAQTSVSREQLLGAEPLRALISSMIHEDSMGNLSEVPTYYSGAPPPSYRTYATSIRSMSSFGCIDGFRSPNGNRRQSSSRRRGMKRKLENLANRLHHTKDSRN
jgi:hypothetical protein